MDIKNYMYKEKDVERLRFYQMPKILFESTRYEKLSLESKALYSILKDRQELSVKNGWKDLEGYIYSYYTIENMAEITNLSKSKVNKLKNELIKAKLLITKRQGLNKPNRLYVLKPIVLANERKCFLEPSRSVRENHQEGSNKTTSDTEVSDTKINDTEKKPYTSFDKEADVSETNKNLSYLYDIDDEKIQLFGNMYVETFNKIHRKTSMKCFDNDTILEMDLIYFREAVEDFFISCKYDYNRSNIDYFNHVGDRYK
ncbi:MAG: replication initiator protein A [Candidatus Heimdallarchaeaceae archaeon]